MVQIFRSIVARIWGSTTAASPMMKVDDFLGVRAMSNSEKAYSERVTKEIRHEARSLLAEMPKRFG
jgi:hypothetical protein